jgi:hypothetical protein
MNDRARAYARTRYIVEMDGRRIVIVIGAVVPDLVAPGAVVTASNPGSRRMAPAFNARAGDELAAWIKARDLVAWPSVSEPEDPDWVEPGWLISGLDLAAAVALAAQFGQNALVWIAPGEPARLVWAGDRCTDQV